MGPSIHVRSRDERPEIDAPSTQLRRARCAFMLRYASARLRPWSRRRRTPRERVPTRPPRARALPIQGKRGYSEQNSRPARLPAIFHMKPESELIEQLSRQNIDFTRESTAAPYFAALALNFPTCGSKIDWGQAGRSTLSSADITDWQQYLPVAFSFLQEVSEQSELSGDLEVVVIGDSSMEGALVMRLDAVFACLESLLAMPQHTYVLPRDARWCVVFTMEGDLCFGYAPS